MSLDVRRPFARLAAAACLIVSGLTLACCVPPKTTGLQQPPQVVRPAIVPPIAPTPVVQTPNVVPPPQVTPPPVVANTSGKVVVAMLLPLSGPSAAVGQAMLNAAQMALYDLADERLQLLTRDTQGTANGASDAAQKAVAAGAQLILGPLLQAEVEAVKPIAQSARVPVIAFSTAAQLAGQGVYLMGFLPGQEVDRVISYAHGHGHDRFAALLPRTAYGQVIADAVQNAITANGATLVRTEFYDSSVNDMASAVKRFAQQGVDFDALFMAEGGARLKVLAPQLPFFKIDQDKVKYLGPGLWDEPGLGTEPALEGGWYAAPPPDARAAFEQHYSDLYKTKAPRLATLGYDAMALAAVLARSPNGADFSDATLASANGFAGLDGIFRFRGNGLVQRGLAVLEVHRAGGTVIDKGPATFQDLGF